MEHTFGLSELAEHYHLEQLPFNVPDIPQLQLGDVFAIDAVLLLIIAGMLLLGLYQGFMWQVVRCSGVALTAFAIKVWADPIAERLARQLPTSLVPYAWGIALTGLIVGGLCLIAILGKAGARLLDAARMNVINRLIGALAGVVTALAVCSAALVVLCQFATDGFLERNVAGSWSESLITTLGAQRQGYLEAAPPAIEDDREYESEAPNPEWIRDEDEDLDQVSRPRRSKVK